MASPDTRDRWIGFSSTSTTRPTPQSATSATKGEGDATTNNHALLRFHETVKDAIDPNGILSPGRYGIWPRHLRKA